MRWWPFSRGGGDGAAAAVSSSSSSSSVDSSESPKTASSSAFRQQISSWTDSVSKADWKKLAEPQTWMPPTLAVAAALGFSAFYRSYLRRIPTTNHIQPRFFRRRSLLGRVTSVGDGDNFHLYHTPGGRLAGWGWLRRVPTYRKELKGQTIPVRLAGIDAPECAHFGRPAQPYSGEALDFLTQYILGRRVRAYLFRRDQYDRVVARVMVRRFFFFRRDVGYEMIKRGLATCYEAKTGSEFGGREAQYRVAEVKAKARKRGLWSGGSGNGEVETPREYKNRMAAEDAERAKDSVKVEASTSAKKVIAKTTAATAGAVATNTTSTPSSPAVAVAAKPTPTPIPVATVTVTPKQAPATLATAFSGKPQTPSPSQTPNLTLPAVGGGPVPARITATTAKQ